MSRLSSTCVTALFEMERKPRELKEEEVEGGGEVEGGRGKRKKTSG